MMLRTDGPRFRRWLLLAHQQLGKGRFKIRASTDQAEEPVLTVDGEMEVTNIARWNPIGILSTVNFDRPCNLYLEVRLEDGEWFLFREMHVRESPICRAKCCQHCRTQTRVIIAACGFPRVTSRGQISAFSGSGLGRRRLGKIEPPCGRRLPCGRVPGRTVRIGANESPTRATCPACRTTVAG